MLKKLLLVLATFIATMGFAFAQVDVNKADQAALDSVKGLGPVTSKAILDERKKGGNFKDWSDFENRVKGIGEKRGANLSEAGLTVNGQARSGSPAAKDDKKKAAKDAKPAADASGKDGKATDAKAAGKDAKAGDTKASDTRAAAKEGKAADNKAAAPAASSGAKDGKAADSKDARKDAKKEEAKK